MNDRIRVSMQGIKKMADEVQTAIDYIYKAQDMLNRLENFSAGTQQALKDKDGGKTIGLFDSVMAHKSLINRCLDTANAFMARTSAHLSAYMSYRKEGATE